MDEQLNNQTRAVILRLPQVNWQTIALLLIILVAAFQTFQLMNLKANAVITPFGGSTIQTPAPANNSGLQGMVGGC